MHQRRRGSDHSDPDGPRQSRQDAGTLQVWGFFTPGSTLDQLDHVFSMFTEQYPWITVKYVPNKEDDKVAAAINGNVHFDIAMLAGADNLGKFCSTDSFVALTRVVVPLAKPAIMAIALFNFLYAWNDFFGPLLFLQDESKYTLAIGLQQLRTLYHVEWNLTLAASLLVVLPLMVIFFLASGCSSRGSP